jgi:hypothetical protein
MEMPNNYASRRKVSPKRLDIERQLANIEQDSTVCHCSADSIGRHKSLSKVQLLWPPPPIWIEDLWREGKDPDFGNAVRPVVQD